MDDTTPMQHGRANPGYRGMFALPPTQFSREALTELARAQGQASVGGGSSMPAGYTYLGQFIDHDVTKLARGDRAPGPDPVPPDELVQLVTPEMDLDSVYGKGWEDESIRVDPKTGKFASYATDARGLIFDLPRKQEPCDPQGMCFSAVIPDGRNDENFIIAQLHVFFLNLHNFIVDRYREKTGLQDARKLFESARYEAIVLYQHIVKNDFLERVLNKDVYDYLFVQSGRPTLLNPGPGGDRRMPTEFSGAAFRFGHSMVRTQYNLNENEDSRNVTLRTLFLLTGRGGAISRDTAWKHKIDWRFFFRFEGGYPRGGPNKANTITTSLVKDLRDLPGEPTDARNLILRNLLRGRELDLPDAQSVIREIETRVPEYKDELGLRILTPVDLLVGELAGALRRLNMHERTPLWTYLLIESWFESRPSPDADTRLGMLGSIIVGEVLRALLIISKPTPPPGHEPLANDVSRDVGKSTDEFRIADLMRLVYSY